MTRKRRNIRIRNLKYILKIKMKKKWRKRRKSPNLKMRKIRLKSEKTSNSTLQ